MNSLDKVQPKIKSGNEQLSYLNQSLNVSLLDFWKWSSSDILSNATRGVLAEFIVATALNIDINTIREEWAPYDLTTSEGIKIEVKSAAYLQSWSQNTLSAISFGTKAARCWDYVNDRRDDIVKRHADVYVFCHLTAEDKLHVDPLNLDYWDFYVLSTHELNNYARSQHSITLRSLKKLAQITPYNELMNEVNIKHQLNPQLNIQSD